MQLFKLITLLLTLPLLIAALPLTTATLPIPSFSNIQIRDATTGAEVDLPAFITAIFDGLANVIAATGGAAANTIAATGGAAANGLGERDVGWIVADGSGTEADDGSGGNGVVKRGRNLGREIVNEKREVEVEN